MPDIFLYAGLTPHSNIQLCDPTALCGGATTSRFDRLTPLGTWNEWSHRFLTAAQRGSIASSGTWNSIIVLMDWTDWSDRMLTLDMRTATVTDNNFDGAWASPDYPSWEHRFFDSEQRTTVDA